MVNNNSILIEFCKALVEWIIKRAIVTHNEHLQSNNNEYKSGVAFSYYEVYSLLQLQAEAFLIPLSILGLEDKKEEDFLSTSIITETNSRVMDSISGKWEKVIINWMRDNIFLIKENAINFGNVVNSKSNSINCDKDFFDSEFDKGHLFGYLEIITFMQEQAKKIGISLKDLNLDDVNPNLGDCNRLQI